ncbi:hypothetical protein GF322_05295 [Candidatus Dependentiae bacterium]|nr:hypothetical protein [Candidatus Dependentiae bacterium]
MLLKKLKKTILILYSMCLLNTIKLQIFSDNKMIKYANLIKTHSQIYNFEKNVINQQSIYRQKKLEKLLNLKTNKKKTRIAICCSGGGLRATLATSGLLHAFQEIELLDCITHISTLSGSTWTVIAWLFSNQRYDIFEQKLIKNLDHIDQLRKISNLNFEKFKQIKNLFKQTYVALTKNKNFKKKINQNISFIDLYGLLLCNLMLYDLGEKRFELKLSDLQQNLQNKNHPFPIFTAASQLDSYKYQWLEFTPYFIGSYYLNSYVFPNEFGKTFYSGKTLDSFSELPISYLMAIFGSAFSTSLRDAIHKIGSILNKNEIQKIIQNTENLISNLTWANKKILPAQICNFTYGMQNSPIKNCNNISIVDGGYLCNIPLEPLLQPHRKLDIIFVLDNTSLKYIPAGFELKKACTTAQTKNLKLPIIDYEKAINENFSIFKNENDPHCPTIVYIPLKKDINYSKSFDPQTAKFCKTTNFFYSKKQGEMLSGLTRHIILKNKQKIYSLIKKKIEQYHFLSSNNDFLISHKKSKASLGEKLFKSVF